MSKKFIAKQVSLYKDFSCIHCPALDEEVYFNSNGLHHILYLKRRPRSLKERHYRAALIPYINETIESAKVYTKTKAVEFKKEICLFVLEHQVESELGTQIIKVILKREGRGQLFFLSVMRKKFIH